MTSWSCWRRVVAQDLADFHDVTCEAGLFTPEQALRMLRRSQELGILTRTHSDAWASSQGWETAVAGGALSAEHLTYTPDEEIRAVGETDTVAVLLPQAELVYMTDRRANARLFMRDGRARRHRHRLLLLDPRHRADRHHRPGRAMVSHHPGEAIVGATLNAAYALRAAADRGSIDPGKRGDLTILSVDHPRGAVPRRRPGRRSRGDHRRRGGARRRPGGLLSNPANA